MVQSAIPLPRRGMGSLLLLGSLLAATTTVTAYTPFCTSQAPKDKDNQPSPPSFKYKNFRTDMMMSFLDKNKVMRAVEAYSYYSDQVKVESVDGGKVSGLIMDFGDNTYIEYAYQVGDEINHQCSIQALNQTKTDNFNLWGYLRTAKGNQVFSTAKILSFSENNTFMGKTDIDGLPVDHWQDCVTWDQGVEATFRVDYYFTELKSKSRYYGKDVPVRAIVEGTMVDKSGQVRKIHHIYDYLDFFVASYGSNFDDRVFSVPEFIMCDGSVPSKWGKDLPTIAGSVSYTVETVKNTEAGVSVDTADIRIDAKNKFVRVDQGGTTSISDFTSGVEWVIKTDGCTVRAIDPDNVPSAENRDGYIQMIDRPEIAYFKKDVFYTGAKKYRSLDVSSFAGKDASYFELYVDEGGDIPVGVKVAGSKPGDNDYYNIFNFVQFSQEFNENAFDISQCKKYDESSSMHMILSLNVYNLEGYINEIIENLRNTSARIAGVSIIQISHVDYIFDSTENEFHWFFNILEGEQEKGKQANVMDKLEMKSILDIKKSIRLSIYEGEFSFPISHNWYSNMELMAKSLVNHNQFLLPYINDKVMNKFDGKKDRCVKKFGSNEHDGDLVPSARACAELCLSSKSIPCAFFEYIEATKHCKWSSDESALATLERREGCDTYTKTSLIHFIREYDPLGIVVNTKGAVFKATDDHDACAKFCLEENSFECQSFDICGKSKRCLLHNTHIFAVDDKQSSDKAETDCYHYTRNEFDDYHEEWGKEAVFPGQVEVDIDDRHDCARLCSDSLDGCSMFSTCYHYDEDNKFQKKTCTLVPVSKTSVVKLKPNTSCSTAKIKGLVNAKGGPIAGASKSDDAPAKYNGGDMFGLALGMIVTGVVFGVITVFLLRRYRGWEGFR